MLGLLSLSLTLVLSAPPPARQTFGIDDLLAMQRVSEPQVSPDGKWVVFTVSQPDLQANKNRSDVWLAKVDGSMARPFATHEAADLNARWMPDGKSVVFISTRTGSAQVHRMWLELGGEPEQLTKLPLDVEALEVFPDGKRLLIAMDVYPDIGPNALAETAKRDKEKNPNVVAYDSLLMRRWDSWEDGKRLHLFVWSFDGGEPLDLMPGVDADCPTKPFGGAEDFSISPDGNEVVYTIKEPGKDAAWSTNTNLYLVRSAGGRPAQLTNNPAYDGHPVHSPDGKTLAYLSMARPGFESDRKRVTLLELDAVRGWGKDPLKAPRKLVAPRWDRDVSELIFGKDASTVYVTADDLGQHALFSMSLKNDTVTALVPKGFNASPRRAGDRIVFTQDTLGAPAELMVVSPSSKEVKRVTGLNTRRVESSVRGEFEQFTFDGAKGEKVHAYLVAPAGRTAGKKYPLAVLIHGGPQGSFGNHWHYRWNAQMYAGAGYAVLQVDFHGSTGYGQAFTDSISGDWGGAPYEDIMKGVDAAIAKYPFIDGTRACALGASYGGYLVDWIAGQTDRFKCLVSHDGLFNVESAYFETEELWFPEWEFKGTPWEKPESYAKFNPKDHVAKWKTPILLLHGGKDFRVVESQGFAPFTAAQRRGVPSRFVYFPQENHWVLKPQNAKRWYEEVLGWLEKHTR